MLAPGTSLTVGIPAFNEQGNIAATIAAVLAAASRAPGLRIEILVVDDGSSDRTPDIVRGIACDQPGVRLIQNSRNLGLGQSVRRAIGEATGDRFMIVPGDNDMPAATLELLFRNAAAADVVMTYFVNEEIRGRLRYLVSEVFRLTYTTLFDLYVVYLNGPAVYPAAKLRELTIRSTRFSIVAEINVKLLRQGLTFAEVASTRQTGLAGSSSFSARNLFEAARVLFGLLLDVYVKEPGRYGKKPVRRLIA
jgi:glycosyltransferase involved in cell wall biosynthesis